MATYSGVVLGLLAAAAWGTADLIARFTGRGVGVLRTIFFTQTAAFVMISTWILLTPAGSTGWTGHGPWWAWAASLVGSAIVLSGTYCLYRAITVGVVSIVAPISASYGAVTMILSVATGEVLGAVAMGGLLITIFGVAFASAPGGKSNAASMAGLAPALFSALAFGVGFWLIGAFAVPQLGWAVPIWIYYGAGACAAGTIAVSRGQSLSLPRPALRGLLLVHGLCGVLGYIAYSSGLRTGHIAIVTVLSSLASGVTVLLARLVLAERLSGRQWAGVGAILLGVAMLR